MPRLTVAADKSYGSVWWEGSLQTCRPADLQGSHSTLGGLRTGWAGLAGGWRGRAAPGGTRARGSCSPRWRGSEGGAGEGREPPGASPRSPPLLAPLGAALGRRVAGWAWVHQHRCQHIRQNSTDHYWDNLHCITISTPHSRRSVWPVSLCPGLQQLETAPAHSSGARLGAGQVPTSPSPPAEPESPNAPAAASYSPADEAQSTLNLKVESLVSVARHTTGQTCRTDWARPSITANDIVILILSS